MAEANWWDNPEGGKGESAVIRHAPDDNNYHLPDSEMLGKMRGSPVGRFAIIPAAREDGTSKGFNPGMAGPVHVDPDAPDGGVVFDPASVQGRDIDRAVGTSNYPHQVYYKLGVPAASLGVGRFRNAIAVENHAQQERVNPLMPGRYVVPSSIHDGRQLSEVPVTQPREEPAVPRPMLSPQQQQIPIPAQPPEFAPPMQPQLQPHMQTVQPQFPQHAQTLPTQPQYQQAAQPCYAPPPPPNLDQQMAAFMAGLHGMQQHVGMLSTQIQHLTQQQGQLPPTTGMSPNPLPTRSPQLATLPAEQRQRANVVNDDTYNDQNARPIHARVRRDRQGTIVENGAVEQDPAPRSLMASRPGQSLQEYRDSQEQPNEGVIAGFETLNLPWVDGPIGRKATRKVIFDFGTAGKQMANFHDVIEHETNITLVYDTRYDEGQQYVPPDLKDQVIILQVPHTKKNYHVSSMGLHVSLGVFDQIVLVRRNLEEVGE